MEAVRHARQINREIRLAQAMSSAELYGYAKTLGVPVDLLQKTAKLGRLPVVNFAAGGLGKSSGTSPIVGMFYIALNMMYGIPG